MDELAALIKANLDQAEANLDQIKVGWGVIAANTALIKSARWRLIRNGRLLRRSRAVLDCNKRLLHANDLMFAENSGLLAMHRARH
jgi:hypothetical protein